MLGPTPHTTDTPICPASRRRRRCTAASTHDSGRLIVPSAAAAPPGRHRATCARRSDKTVCATSFPRTIAASPASHPRTVLLEPANRRTPPPLSAGTQTLRRSRRRNRSPPEHLPHVPPRHFPSHFPTYGYLPPCASYWPSRPVAPYPLTAVSGPPTHLRPAPHGTAPPSLSPPAVNLRPLYRPESRKRE